jgi:hypothetical protein
VLVQSVIHFLTFYLFIYHVSSKAATSDIDNYKDFRNAVQKIEAMSAGKMLNAYLDEKAIKSAKVCSFDETTDENYIHIL